MCVIFGAVDAHPSLQDLEDAADANPDGAGVAWLDNGQVRWYKSLDSRKVIARVVEGLPFPYMVHFRLATCGGVKPELAHPFPVTRKAGLHLSGTARAVMVHNGVLPNWEDRILQASLSSGVEIPDGEWTDTRAMAWLAGLSGDRALGLFGEKIMLLRADGLWYWGNGWKDENGLLLSNAYFRHNWSYASVNAADGWKDDTKLAS
jgi:hypothetical protein